MPRSARGRRAGRGVPGRAGGGWRALPGAARPRPQPVHGRAPAGPGPGTTCEAGGDWRAASHDRSRAPGSSVQKKMGFGVNLGV